MMGFSYLSMTIFLAFLVHSGRAQSTESHIYHECSNVSSTLTYQMNVDSVLALISSNKEIQYGFYNFSFGQGSDRPTAIATSPKKSATDVSTSPPPQMSRSYALVQCTPDLTKRGCANCLDNAFRDVSKYFPRKQGGRVFRPVCNFRYELNQFYETTSVAPPPSPAGDDPLEGTRNTAGRNIIIVVASTFGFVYWSVSFVWL